MNAEFFDAVADIEKEKGIPREYMYEKIRQAMLTAFRKDTPDCEDNVEVILDEAKKKIEMVVKKTVVARVIDPYVERSVRKRRTASASAPRSATLSASRSRPSSSAASRRRLPSRSSFRAFARRSAA